MFSHTYLINQGFTQALFTTTFFHLRLSLKCSWGSLCWKLCLKQHSTTIKLLNMPLFFFAVINGIVIYCIITSNSCSHKLFITKQLKKSTSFVSHGLALYVKEGLPFGWDLSLENSENSYLHTMTYAFN